MLEIGLDLVLEFLLGTGLLLLLLLRWFCIVAAWVMGSRGASLQCRFALNVDALDRSHSEKQVLNQERFLDIYWELAEVLLILRSIGFSTARRWRVLYKSCILRRDVIVIQMWPFE